VPPIRKRANSLDILWNAFLLSLFKRLSQVMKNLSKLVCPLNL
jgi:transcriptional regulator with PAS, ATPase and Fis domain